MGLPKLTGNGGFDLPDAKVQDVLQSPNAVAGHALG
jgi:hypothetical protein